MYFGFANQSVFTSALALDLRKGFGLLLNPTIR
jgi:hypothetical protein